MTTRATGNRPTACFSPSLYRAYLALAGVLAALLVARSYHDLEWSNQVVLAATVADLLVVLVLALTYALVSRLAPAASYLARWNIWMHWTLVVFSLLLATLAQALFLKTGDILNPDILFFFVQRSGELLVVATGAADIEMLMVFAVGVVMALLALLRFRSRVLAGLQYAVFLLPVAIATGGPWLLPEASGKQEIVLPAEFESKLLYRGVYRDLAEHQMAWNAPTVTHWRKGILSGMALGSALGALEYRTLLSSDPVAVIYQAPQLLPSPAKRPNVIFILLESLRHDVVGAYAGDLARGSGEVNSASMTPYIDTLARQGWMAEQAYTTIPHTSKALVGIYCGSFPRFETDISEARPGGIALPCLPHLLSSAGYRTAHFQTAPGGFEERLQFLANVGFEHRFTQESIAGKDWARLGYLGVDDRAMVDPAVMWMRQQADAGRPFFASLLTIATHHPYVSPGHIEAVHDPAQAKQAYLKAVRDTDAILRELFDKLRKSDLLENTLIVITGDHGEAFAEHGQIAHNGAAYEEGMRVPLILSGPMLGPPRRIGGLRQHIDLMPTVLDLAGLRYSGKLPGRSLLTDAVGHSDLITSCFYRDYCLNHISKDGRKVLFFFGKRSPEMYDLRSDPGEQHNLYSEATHDDAMQRLRVAAALKKSFEAVYSPVVRAAAAP